MLQGPVDSSSIRDAVLRDSARALVGAQDDPVARHTRVRCPGTKVRLWTGAVAANHLRSNCARIARMLVGGSRSSPGPAQTQQCSHTNSFFVTIERHRLVSMDPLVHGGNIIVRRREIRGRGQAVDMGVAEDGAKRQGRRIPSATNYRSGRLCRGEGKVGKSMFGRDPCASGGLLGARGRLGSHVNAFLHQHAIAIVLAR
mmetsp:Transcript_30781/g.57399  ORF Transcript_30781/g.57399 Transcript_30781/m.57399 type:complete len:200 (-) Transcript_30781:744-1343(-)